MNIQKRIITILLMIIVTFTLSACGTQPAYDEAANGSETIPVKTEDQTGEEEMMDLTLMIDGTAVAVKWEENETVKALMEMASEAPVTVQLSMYGGFEQVGDLGTSLPKNDVQITTEPGDIVLYSGSNIVLFYGSNSWSYTRLGHITDKSEQEMTKLLGNGDVEIVISAR